MSRAVLAQVGCGLLVLGGLAGCDRQLDFRIDASDYGLTSTAETMIVDLVAGGEIQHREVIDLVAEPTLVLVDVIQVGATHGITAFADVDGDGKCTIEGDDAWTFVYDPVANDEPSWVVERETFRDLNACVWFSGEAPGLED